MTIIKTSRLILRPWRDEDYEPFAKLNADLRVREHFHKPLNREESDQEAKKIQKLIADNGWGFWAVSVPGVAEFIGFIGLNEVTFPAHFTPAIEIGWRIAFDYWGKGYATEGAKAALQYGFEVLGLDEIVSFTTVKNSRSRAVMERIGMHYDPDGDFDHPRVPEGDKLRRHVLYRMYRDEWEKLKS